MTEDLQDLKQQLIELKKLVQEIHDKLIPPPTLPPAKVYQLKERARKKAIEISQKLEGK